MNSEESESITNQKSMIENFIKNNFILDDINIISYCDDGYVGSNFNRPAFKQMIDDIKNNKINCIIVKDLSRFGRDYIEVGNYLDRIFPFLDVRFIAINDNYDSNNNTNSTTDLDIAFKNILYSYYSKDLSVKVKTGFRTKAKQGYYLSSYVPFGYKKNKEIKKLEIDVETAPIVKMIFDLLNEGYKRAEVCNILNEKGVPRKSYFKMKNNERKSYHNLLNNKIWRVEDLRKIVDDEVYIGNTVMFKRKKVKVGSNKTIKSNSDEIVIVENTHEPIISKEIFYNCKRTNKCGYRRNSIDSLFNGKLKCNECKYSLRYSRIVKDKQIVDKRYYCSSKKLIENLKCKDISIMESELKQIVFESLKKEISIYLDRNLDKVNIKNLKNDISNLVKEMDTLIINKNILYEKYFYKKLTKEEYLVEKKQNEYNIENIKKEIERLKLEILENEKIDSNINFLKQYLKVSELTKNMIDTFIKNIYIFDKDNIKIEWNFK